MTQSEPQSIRPEVLTYDDVRRLVPKLNGHEKLVNYLLRLLKVDRINQAHANCCDTPGAEFTRRLLFDEFHMKLRVDGQEVLDNLPEGAFITVSNHPFGALDGIALIYLIASRRPEFKVMVNMILNQIGAMRQNFIAVDAWAQKDPKKRAVSVNGIRAALRQIAHGQPVGFFPAGAMSKISLRGYLEDRTWQESVLQIIHRAKVPVVPVYFHGTNRWWFNLLGHICWPMRSICLPSEVVHKNGKEMHISIGQPISLAEQEPYRANAETLGAYLRQQTYALRKRK